MGWSQRGVEEGGFEGGGIVLLLFLLAEIMPTILKFNRQVWMLTYRILNLNIIKLFGVKSKIF